MKKLTTTLLTFILLTEIASAAPARQKGDWSAVQALVKTSIGVKTKGGETHFGLLQSADDAGIEIQIAGHDDFTGQEISLRRDEVERVWIARLRFGQKNVGKGALIGAGAGLGAAYLTALVLSERGSSDPPVGVGLFPIYGAGIGAVSGVFWKKKHKKLELIYSV